MTPALRDAIHAKVPIVGDGAMGTELQAAGLEPGGCGDDWNLSHPEQVLAIHRAYVDAGAQVILTNTFGTNHYVLSRYGLEDRAGEIARAAASHARAAAAGRAWVLADIGPCGGFLAPLGDVEPRHLEETWREVLGAMLEVGVDGVLVETMTALDELLLAVRVARDLGAPLVVASMSYDPLVGGGFKTMMGVAPEEAAKAAVAAGADLVGANCGRLEPEDFADVALRLSVAGGVPVMVQPNAGQPRLEGDAIVYPRGPADLAPVLASLTRQAVIVGGCCGTTPAHIRAFGEALSGQVRLPGL